MKRISGFTLVELLVTLAIIGIIIGVAVPALTTVVNSGNMVGQLSKLTGVLAYGRSEAVAQSVPVVVCSSGDGAACANSVNWEQGWIAFTDVGNDGAPNLGGGNCAAGEDCMLIVEDALPDGVTLRGTVTSVVYTATGEPAAGGGTTFRLCGADALSNNDTDYSRTVTISAPGSASVAMGTAACP